LTNEEFEQRIKEEDLQIKKEDLQIKMEDLRIKKRELSTKWGMVLAAVLTIGVGLWQQHEQAKQQRALEEKTANEQRALEEKTASEQRALEERNAKQQLAIEETKVNQEFWKLRAQTCMDLSKVAAQVAVEQGKNGNAVREVQSLAWGPASIVKTNSDQAAPGPAADGRSMSAAISAYLKRLDECRSPIPPQNCWNRLKSCAENIGYECASALCGMLTGSARTVCPTDVRRSTECPAAIAQLAPLVVAK
jgi:cytoskeletal protein RodZ